jgi:hypothetical protein
VIGCDTEVSRAAFDHLEHAIQDADDGAVRLVFAFVESPQSIEMSEQLVRTVDEMDEHSGEQVGRLRRRVRQDQRDR